MKQLLDALQHCHSLNISHRFILIFNLLTFGRDVKLENILIKHTKTGLVVKLADFGEASMFKVMNDFCGSLHYADPKIL